MRQKSERHHNAADRTVKDIRRKTRQATSPEVKGLRSESAALKEVVAELTLENRLLKKIMIGDGGDEE